MSIFHAKTTFQLLKIRLQIILEFFINPKYIFSKVGLKILYFSFVHSYLYYGNIAWGSTTQTKLKKLASKQRQAIRVIYGGEYTRLKMEEMKVLNIYKFNTYQVLTFMFKIKRDTGQWLFETISKKYLIIILHNLVKVTSQKIILCQTKQNLVFRLKVQGSETNF